MVYLEENNWCLWVWEKDTDFILEEWDADWLPTLFEQDEIFFEYNQNANDWSKKSCTIFNAIGAVSDLMNYKFLLNQIKDIDDLSYEQGRLKGYGWETKKAIDLVRNWWNSNTELVKQYGKVASYRINMCDDDLVWKVLNKNYTICWWYKGNSAYQKDYRADWVLDGYEFWTKTYSHSTALRKINGKKCVKDNYEGRTNNWRPTNIYEIKPTCKQEVTGWTFFYWWYLFTKVKEDNYEELIRFNKMKTLLNTACDCHSQLRYLTKDKKYQDFLHDINETHRNKIKDCDAQMILHS